jgi:hypothetical protein
MGRHINWRTMTCQPLEKGYTRGMKASLWALIFAVVVGASAKAQQPALPKSTNAPSTNSTITPKLTRSQKVVVLETHGYDTFSWDVKPNPNGDYDVVPSPLNLLGLPELRAKAAKGDIAAQCVLGRKYGLGDGVPQDYAESLKWYRKAADQGDAQAQDAVGFIFEYGNGVSQDYVESAKWYRKAADQGDPRAQYNLGVCYSYGQGVPQDYAEAVKWWRKAAEQGMPGAQCNLGFSYFKGRGVPQDYAEALKWYRKAAAQGDAVAENNLGGCYANGNGVPQDYVEAVNWFRKAADQGDAQAQDFLGFSYEYGNGVPQNSAEAVKWYRKAAAQEDAFAQNNLGGCYADGTGVLRDYVQAYKWINLASAQGVNSANQFLPFLELRMTPEQIAEGQRLAREFRPSQTAEQIASLPRLWTRDASPRESGTGFFITQDGFLLTAAHVVNGANQIRLVTSAGLLTVRLVKLDAANDLALLKADGQFSPLPIASSRAVKLGSTAATVGFPNTGMQGFAPKLAKGEIASLTGPQDDPRYFQVSVPLQPGNSGGALVDERGNVVGIVSAKLDAATALATTGALPENVNYAIKSSFLLSFLESAPEVSAKLKEANAKDRKFEDVVQSAQKAAVLVLVY